MGDYRAFAHESDRAARRKTGERVDELRLVDADIGLIANAGLVASGQNAFKRIAAGASAEEKLALFSGTARRVYRLD